jgi:hypothetical protein
VAPKLTPEEVVTLTVLKHKGQPNTQIAQGRMCAVASRWTSSGASSEGVP